MHFGEYIHYFGMSCGGEGIAPVLFEPSDEFFRTLDLVAHPVDAEKSLILPKALKAFPESWMKVYWIVIAPNGYEDIGVEHVYR